jgi:hypothetical protein
VGSHPWDSLTIGWAARRVSRLQLSSNLLDTQCYTPLHFNVLVIGFILVLELTPWYVIVISVWAYGKGWPWTLQCITKTCLALPFYALQADTPVTALRVSQGWLPVGLLACGFLLPPWIPNAVRLWTFSVLVIGFILLLELTVFSINYDIFLPFFPFWGATVKRTKAVESCPNCLLVSGRQSLNWKEPPRTTFSLGPENTMKPKD